MTAWIAGAPGVCSGLLPVKSPIKIWQPCIEYHPENGDVPYVVVTKLERGDDTHIWMAYPTADAAFTKLRNEHNRLRGA